MPRFKNPSNGYIENVSNWSILWCFLFGIFYFMVKGIWKHVLISLVLAIVTFGISWLVYPFLAKGIIEKDYQRRGWKKLKSKA